MKYLYLGEIDSTNKYVKENFDKLDDLTCVYTYNQTSGRGRMEREWTYTGTENIYATLVIKINSLKNVYSNLTQYLCVVLAETFEEYGVKPCIKWPNDILINRKKISGILAESINGNNNKIEGIALGFGINLNTTKEILAEINKPATSLNIETGKDIDKEIFLKKLLNRFCLLYNRFIDEGFAFIREDYIKRAGFIGREITVKVFDKSIQGVAKGIDKNGALVLTDKNNKEQILYIGDIL